MKLCNENNRSIFLKTLKDKYNERVNYIDPDHNQNVFSWMDHKLHINILLTHDSYSNDTSSFVLMFATISSSTKDEFTYKNLISETHNYEYDHIKQTIDNLKYLIKNKLISNEEFLESSFCFVYIQNNDFTDTSITSLANSFADNEYENASKRLQNNLISTTNLKIIKSKYFTDRYHFDEIESSINDDQFTYELENCLEAYQNGMWFVASTGIGSVIEHLLYLTIVNLDKTWTPSEANPQRPLRQLGKGPTKTNYINALSKCLPRFDDRQRSQLEAMFLLRNSVDHFNSGYSNKGFCDTLLQGIVDIYNGIYLQSV